jgi:uncharacterized membrane protein YdbT with pleckstrin-like domain
MTSDKMIWQGRPSQWVNAWWFLACLLVLPIPWAIWRWMAVRCTSYEVTDQRLRFRRGVLRRELDDIELYRVKDSSLVQPFFQRVVGLGTVRLVTSDATHAVFDIHAIKDPLTVHDRIRDRVEVLRRERGVRELDVN